MNLKQRQLSLRSLTGKNEGYLSLVTIHIDILSVGGGRAEGQVNNRCDVVTRCYDIWRHSTIVWPATVTPRM